VFKKASIFKNLLNSQVCSHVISTGGRLDGFFHQKNLFFGGDMPCQKNAYKKASNSNLAFLIPNFFIDYAIYIVLLECDEFLQKNI
jgi:hypothetical protein